TTLSLHDALPISEHVGDVGNTSSRDRARDLHPGQFRRGDQVTGGVTFPQDRQNLWRLLFDEDTLQQRTCIHVEVGQRSSRSSRSTERVPRGNVRVGSMSRKGSGASTVPALTARSMGVESDAIPS